MGVMAASASGGRSLCLKVAPMEVMEDGAVI
jgi:hypothetical protein